MTHIKKTLRENKNIKLLSGDKDSGIIIMNKTDYETKIQIMIEGERWRVHPD